MQDLESNKKNNFPLWGKLLVGFGVIGVLVAISLPSFFNQSSKADNARARMAIGSAINLQVKNYEKTGKFAQSWDELSSGIPSKNDSYEFQVSLIAGNAIVTATPKKEGLRSLTGFTFFSSTSVFSAVCETLQPSRTAPQVDLTSKSVECPVGSVLLK